jgi:membrane protein DedA with SNARE-associated domain
MIPSMGFLMMVFASILFGVGIGFILGHFAGQRAAARKASRGFPVDDVKDER